MVPVTAVKLAIASSVDVYATWSAYELMSYNVQADSLDIVVGRRRERFRQLRLLLSCRLARNDFKSPFTAIQGDPTRMYLYSPTAYCPIAHLSLLALSQVESLAESLISFIASTSETTHPDQISNDATGLEQLRAKATGNGGELTVDSMTLSTVTA